MGTGHYSIRLVAGVGRTEKLVSACLDLPEPAAEILEWRKSVVVQHVEVIPGGVIVTGHVRSRCLFLTPDRAPPPPAAISGRVLHHSAEIGFALHIRVRGAASGMDARVTAAHVLADASEPLLSADAGWIAGVADRSLIRLTVRVVRPELLPVHRPGPRRRKCQAPPILRQAQAPPAPCEAPPPCKAAPPRRKRSRPAPPIALPPPRGAGLWLHPSAAVPVTDAKPRCD